MILPRWHLQQRFRSWQRWDQAIAFLTAVNLAWVVFDLSYIPLRNFWLQRKLYPIPSLPLVVPLPWLPNVTRFYDPVKGIKPHHDTQAYIDHFAKLDLALQSNNRSDKLIQPMLKRQVKMTKRMIDTNSFLSSGKTGALEKLKNRLRSYSGLESSESSTSHLLSLDYLNNRDWEIERLFWTRQILPLVETNYWRSIDETGNPTDLSWRIDTPFKLLFLLDILLRCLRMKLRYPAIRWREALLRRWIDLPLLLPFARWLRLVPVTERLSNTGLVQLEPLRAVISRGVVALLALELFEVITIRLLDSLQQLIHSPQLPQRIRNLCSYHTTDNKTQRNLIELIQLWLPLLLTRIGPSMRPKLIALLSRIIYQNRKISFTTDSLRALPGLQQAESELNRQLAEGLIDAILEFLKGAGSRIGRRDHILEGLSNDTLDSFFEELARIMDEGPILKRSQDLLLSLLEDIKRSSFEQLRDQGGVSALISELDGLNFSPQDTSQKSLE